MSHFFPPGLIDELLENLPNCGRLELLWNIYYFSESPSSLPKKNMDQHDQSINLGTSLSSESKLIKIDFFSNITKSLFLFNKSSARNCKLSSRDLEQHYLQIRLVADGLLPNVTEIYLNFSNIKIPAKIHPHIPYQIPTRSPMLNSHILPSTFTSGLKSMTKLEKLIISQLPRMHAMTDEWYHKNIITPNHEIDANITNTKITKENPVCEERVENGEAENRNCLGIIYKLYKTIILTGPDHNSSPPTPPHHPIEFLFPPANPPLPLPPLEMEKVDLKELLVLEKLKEFTYYNARGYGLTDIKAIVQSTYFPSLSTLSIGHSRDQITNEFLYKWVYEMTKVMHFDDEFLDGLSILSPVSPTAFQRCPAITFSSYLPQTLKLSRDEKIEKVLSSCEFQSNENLKTVRFGSLSCIKSDSFIKLTTDCPNLTSVTFIEMDIQPYDEDRVKMIGTSKYLNNIKELSLKMDGLKDPTLFENLPNFVNITNLYLHRATPQQVSTYITHSSYFDKLVCLLVQLRRMSQDDCDKMVEALVELFESDKVQNLTEIELMDLCPSEPYKESFFQALATSAKLNQLQELNLCNYLGMYGDDEAGDDNWGEEEEEGEEEGEEEEDMNEDDNNSSGEDNDPILRNDTELIFNDDLNTTSPFQSFFTSKNLSNLHKLSIVNMGLTDRDLYLLANSPYLQNLTTLVLDEPMITDLGVKYLCNSPYLTSLKAFEIGGSKLTQRSITFLSKAQRLLYNIDEFKMTSFGVHSLDELCQSPHFYAFNAQLEHF